MNQSTIRKSGIWGNLPLSRKLLLAFGILFVLSLGIAAAGLQGLNRVQGAYEGALAGGVQIQNLSDHLNNELLEARRSERDFLLLWKEEGFDTAYAHYVVANQSYTAEMKSTLNAMSAVASQVGRADLDAYTQARFEADITSLHQGVLAYEESFANVVALIEERGFVNTGLEGAFGNDVQAIEEKVLGTDDQLTITMLQIRRREKDYLLRGDEQYLVDVTDLVTQLKTQTVQSEAISISEKTEIITLADSYLAGFGRLVEKDRQIAEATEIFRTAAANIQIITDRIEFEGEQLAVLDINTAKIHSTQTTLLTIGTVLIVLFASIVLALVMARQLTQPILQLTKIAGMIASGKFNAQAEVSSSDEVGTLAKTFNSMTERLSQAFAEVRRRAAELATVAEVSTATSTILDSKRLLQEVVDLTKERFDLYHSHIYLLDEKGENLVLSAGAGEPGRAMVAEGRSIPLSREQSLVARAAREHKGVIVNDVTQVSDFLPNPLLPDTRSELAVPMVVGGNVIGVFDIQSEHVGRFTESDVNIQTTLAAQLATSIQNVRSFEQSKKQAELQSLVNVIGSRIQRTTSIEETLQTAIRELGTAIGASRVKAKIQPASKAISIEPAATTNFQ